ncbi:MULTISPECIES: 7-carboxy-7-deazaguanine synthase QueE [unclassified Psychrobacter]|uniref:7-carboxy-7-deazaguanine synthase QueE n=1 Tax=unclassified Psychrobacter TaxID=196806 RepID=UPI000ED14E6B|nr:MULTISPECIES: 7-carboxy-7-deazaguanine synthase QueE [unclassified Psychrobacter]MBE8610451.1 7-carboxy-7-deazaguanine synthase QueE [Pseudomonas lundensis]HCI76796.1 7-carboxy-7-deazaguanine synthase QueE [Psychrobacter sp.]
MSESLLRTAAIPVTDPEAGLRLTEIFYSLQGEALTSGLPTIFVRLTGCPLRCVYCDTEYAFTGGERQSLETIIETIKSYPCKRICLTGGEPLAQPNAIELMKRLLNDGYEISLETAGALTVANVPKAVSKVMDLKTPSSGEVDKNLWSNLDYLTQHDQIKFVIMNRTDYDWAKAMLIEHELNDLVGTVWFSPMFNVAEDIDDEVSPDVPLLARELAEWMLADALPVRFQLQLHKIIWADAKGK